jgi:dsDNA-binding SOS-regulon protein
VLPNSQIPRHLKVNMDSASELHKWLTRKELQCGVKNHESAQLFTDNQRELKGLAEAIRDLDPNAESRVERMSGGEVLGTALIMWLKNEADDIEVAKRAVKMVWPRMGAKRSLIHPEWAESCDTKLDLASRIESWLRTYSARCEGTYSSSHIGVLGVNMVCALHATTQKAEHSAHGVRSPSHNYQMGTNIQTPAARLGHHVSTFMPWESNGSKR